MILYLQLLLSPTFGSLIVRASAIVVRLGLHTQSSKKSFRFRSIHFGFVGHLCYADSLAFYKPNVRTVALFSSLLDLGLYCKSLVVSHRAVDSGSGCIGYVNQLLKSICMNSSNNFIEKILCLRPACDAAEVVRRCAFF